MWRVSYFCKFINSQILLLRNINCQYIIGDDTFSLTIIFFPVLVYYDRFCFFHFLTQVRNFSLRLLHCPYISIFGTGLTYFPHSIYHGSLFLSIKFISIDPKKKRKRVMATKRCFFLWGLSFCMILRFAYIEAAPKGSLVTHLPGFSGTFPSKHYSGQVNFYIPRLFGGLVFHVVTIIKRFDTNLWFLFLIL